MINFAAGKKKTFMISGDLSAVYSGFCAQECLDGTCRKYMEFGRMDTVGSVGGVTFFKTYILYKNDRKRNRY